MIRFIEFLRTHSTLAIALLCVILISSLQIVGVYHADEHYQILEFAHTKMYAVDPSYLPWEYLKRIRPWFQPGLYMIFFKSLEGIGIESPFKWLFTLRLVNCTFFFYGMYVLYKRYKDEFIDKRLSQFFIYFTFFLWFFPFFSTRSGSETLATIVFMFCFDLFLTKNISNKIATLIGLLFGAIFLIRFHFAVSIFFLCLWSLIFRERSIKELFIITLSCFTVIAAGGAIDFWGYGHWQFTLWNFYYENIINGVAASFGTSPWWRYFYEVQKEFSPVIGVPVVASFLYFWGKYYKHPVAWVTLSFFAFHSLISHKELRFIFPLVIFVPYILSVFVRDIWTNLKIRNGFLALIVIINTVYLIFTVFRPAYHGVGFYEYLYKYHNSVDTIYYTGTVKPNNIIHNEMKFYKVDNLDYQKVSSFEQALKENETIYFHSRSGKDYLKIRKDKRCVELYPNLNILEEAIYYKNKIERSDVYFLFRCHLSL